MGISIPIVLPFFYILATTAYMACYAAYPVIDKYMIAPYASADEEEFIYFKENEEEIDSTNDDMDV